jgi:hypothetical protein
VRLGESSIGLRERLAVGQYRKYISVSINNPVNPSSIVGSWRAVQASQPSMRALQNQIRIPYVNNLDCVWVFFNIGMPRFVDRKWVSMYVAAAGPPFTSLKFVTSNRYLNWKKAIHEPQVPMVELYHTTATSVPYIVPGIGGTRLKRAGRRGDLLFVTSTS